MAWRYIRIMVRYLKQMSLVCYRAGHNMLSNFGIETAGYLTFVFLLSLFPYLILMVSAVGWAGQGKLGREYIQLFLDHLPGEAVSTLAPRINEILNGPPQHLLTFAVLGAIWTSSSGIEGIRGMLNRAYRVSAPPAYLARRLTSFLQVIVLTIMVVGVILLLVTTPIALNFLTDFTGIEIPFEIRDFIDKYFLVFGIAALFIVVYSMYYVLPNVKQTRWRVMPGALLVVLLWILGAVAVSFYLNRISQLTPVYGSLSGFIATLIFFYVMTLIFIYGAEFNHELHLLRVGFVEEAEPANELLAPENPQSPAPAPVPSSTAPPRA